MVDTCNPFPPEGTGPTAEPSAMKDFFSKKNPHNILIIHPEVSNRPRKEINGTGSFGNLFFL